MVQVLYSDRVHVQMEKLGAEVRVGKKQKHMVGLSDKDL